MGTANQDVVDAAAAGIDEMMTSDPSNDMDPQILDAIASTMTSGEGEWDVPTEIGDDMDCESLGKSDFGIQTAGMPSSFGSDPIYQIDYAAECRYEKDVQGRARKVEGILLKLVRNKVLSGREAMLTRLPENGKTTIPSKQSTELASD